MARLLHWLVALAVLGMIPAGLVMTQPDLARPVQDALYLFHKNTGIVILILVVARLAYRARHPAPPLPADMPTWQKWAAGTNHAALYLLLITMAVSGYIRVKAGGYPIESLDALGLPSLAPRSDGIAEAAETVHAVTKNLLIAVIALHVFAAAYHGLIRRDGVVSRMRPW